MIVIIRFEFITCNKLTHLYLLFVFLAKCITHQLRITITFDYVEQVSQMFKPRAE